MNEKAQKELERWLSSARPRLVRMAGSILNDEHEAEDVVQETLVAIWRACFARRIENLPAYASRAVWVNARRRRSRRPVQDMLESEPSVPSGEDHLLTSWELEQAILRLPVSQQTVIRMRYYGGLSFREIGLALRISMNTAASRCRYALHAMRQAMHPGETRS